MNSLRRAAFSTALLRTGVAFGSRLIFDGVVDGALEMAEGGSENSVMVESDVAVLKSLTDLIKCLPGLGRRAGVFSGAMIRVRLADGSSATSSCSLRLRRPGIQPVRPPTRSRQELVGVGAGCLFSAAGVWVDGVAGAAGLCCEISSAGDVVATTCGDGAAVASALASAGEVVSFSQRVSKMNR